MVTYRMIRYSRFPALLAIAQTFIAALFGGVGLWQRSHILSQTFWGDQTLWDSTARFHVWPWPFKFAVITNIPAFFAGALVSLPIHSLWPKVPEAVDLAPSLVFVAMLWYWVGSRLNRRWGDVNAASVLSGTKIPWILLLVFTAACLIGAFVPIGYVGYIYYGVAIWVSPTVIIFVASRRSNAHTPTSLS
jgi:hypothetical protein